MSIAVAKRTDNELLKTFTLYVCPNLDEGKCQCPKGEDGQPSPGHPMYHYAAEPPPPATKKARRMTAEQWADWAAQHAIELETTARGGGG